MSLLFWTRIACVLSSVNFLMKQRISLKQKFFFLFILGHKVLLPYLTKFLNLLIFGGREGPNILRGFIFAGAPKNYVSRGLIFVESPKMVKTTEFYVRENLEGLSSGLNG